MPAAVNNLKVCSACREELPTSQFDHCAANLGFQYVCQACQKKRRELRRTAELRRRREYYQENRSHIRQTKAKYNRGPRAQLRCRAWRAKYPKRQAAASRRWKQANYTRVLQLNANRRAALLGAKGKFTAVQWQAKCEEYNQRCAYCRKKKPLTRHHVTPLSRGGGNDIFNIVPACRSCNSRIKDRIIPPKGMEPCTKNAG